MGDVMCARDLLRWYEMEMIFLMKIHMQYIKEEMSHLKKVMYMKMIDLLSLKQEMIRTSMLMIILTHQQQKEVILG